MVILTEELKEEIEINRKLLDRKKKALRKFCRDVEA